MIYDPNAPPFWERRRGGGEHTEWLEAHRKSREREAANRRRAEVEQRLFFLVDSKPPTTKARAAARSEIVKLRAELASLGGSELCGKGRVINEARDAARVRSACQNHHNGGLPKC